MKADFRLDRFGFASRIHVHLQHKIGVGAQNPGKTGRIEAREFSRLPPQQLPARHRHALRRVQSKKTGGIMSRPPRIAPLSVVSVSGPPCRSFFAPTRLAPRVSSTLMNA